MAVPIRDEEAARLSFPPVISNHSMENDALSKESSLVDGSPAIDRYYPMDVDQEEGTNEIPHSNIFDRFCSWYSAQMDQSPVRTKSAFGGCAAIVGDVLAQLIENNTALRAEPTEGLHAQRIIAMFLTGLTYGPMLHYIYEFYEHVLPIDFDEQCLSGCVGEEDDDKTSKVDTLLDESVVLSGPVKKDDESLPYYMCHSTMFHSFYTISNRKNVNAFLHVAIDQGIMAFAYVAVMMVVTGIVEGHWNQLREEFDNDFINNVHALWLAALIGIGPMQIVAFRYLPLKWRTLAVNVLEVFEVTVMSYITHRNRDAPNDASLR